MGTLVKEVVKISNVFARVATLFDLVVVHSRIEWRTGGEV